MALATAAATWAQEPAPSPTPLAVGAQIKEPKKLKDVRPVYPELAKAAHVQGVVVLGALIDPKGEVATVNVIESIPLLDDAAIEAVKQWIYEPTLVNDVPVPVIMTVRVSFTLKLDASPARPADGAGTLAYVNPAFHWSIAYPSDWQLSSTDPRVVRITLIGQGLIGFYSGFFPKLASLDEFVDYMKKDREEHLAQRISLRFVSQRLLTLPNGSAAIEIIDQLGTGIVGQSRKIDTQLGDHTYLEIDAESKLEDWPGVEPVFTRIIDSFKVAPGK